MPPNVEGLGVAERPQRDDAAVADADVADAFAIVVDDGGALDERSNGAVNETIRRNVDATGSSLPWQGPRALGTWQPKQS